MVAKSSRKKQPWLKPCDCIKDNILDVYPTTQPPVLLQRFKSSAQQSQIGTPWFVYAKSHFISSHSLLSTFQVLFKIMLRLINCDFAKPEFENGFVCFSSSHN